MPKSHTYPARIEGRYTGTWVTTGNKKLDGTMTCDIQQLGRDRWQGRFWGEWQKAPFDYTVEFATESSRPAAPGTMPEKKHDSRSHGSVVAHQVAGAAMIDGASYDWTGTLTAGQFNIQFTGSRYEGHLELARVQETASTNTRSGSVR